MSGNEIINVLVLGTCDVNILQFAKLFGVYLQHDSYEESSKSKIWEKESSLNEDINAITTSIIIVGDKKIKLTCIAGEKYAHTQLMQFMIHFMERQKLRAIIFLIKPSEQKDIWMYKPCLFSKLKVFEDKNILFISSINKDEEFMTTFRKEANQFYFEEDIFYSVSENNWQQSVHFCKKILNYIAGDECGLQDYYIQTGIPQKSLVQLEHNLLELLILIYVFGECYNRIFDDDDDDDDKCYGFYINDYRRNVTICYFNKCVQSWEMDMSEDYPMKIPKICHGPCKCSESVGDVNKCMVLDTPDEKCLQCNCSSYFHSNIYFNVIRQNYPKETVSAIIKKEKDIAINNLAMFFLYNKQHQEINLEDIFLKLIDTEDEEYPNLKAIFDKFKEELNDKVQTLENTSNPITDENILMCIQELYQIKNITHILPSFLEETFPDFKVEVTTDNANETNREATSEITKLKSEKMEIETLRKENAELRLMLQNSNDLNSKLIQDMQALTKQHNLNQTKEDTKEN